MSRRATGLKLALLAAPLAAGVLSLHAFGEPAGRAARAAVATFGYPEHAHGAYRIRVRRGSDYHAFAARTLDDLALEMARTFGLRAPGRVTVLLLDSREDLERFGLDAARLDQGGLADPATGTLALVGDGRTHDQVGDSRALRRQMTRLLLAPGTPPWLAAGMASHFETAGMEAADSRSQGDDLLPLPTLLGAPDGEFRGPAGARSLESARLLVAYLRNRELPELRALLRGEGGSLFEDLPTLETRWRLWCRRPR